MRILKINLDNPEKEIIKETVEALKNGEIVIYPTDTIYGLGANALNENSVKKIFKIKGRNFNKPISIIVRDIKMAKKVAEFDEKTEKIFNKLLPGPVTLILFKKNILPDILTAGTNKIGIRIPDCKFTKILMENLDFPITTTSANLSGEPNSSIKCGPSLFLNCGALNGQPSTIIDLTSPESKIIREGQINQNELKKISENL